MAQRRFGVEVESELWDHTRKPVYPTIAREYCGDVTLQTGFMEIGDRAAVSYKFLHNNVWGHFEVVVEPFRGQEYIGIILLQAYDLASQLPLDYQPWRLVEAGNIFMPDHIDLKKVVDPRDCPIEIRSIDVSLETTLAELGLDERSLPAPMEQSDFNGEWWIKRLDCRNDNLQMAFDHPNIGITEVIPLLRRIAPHYVLHVNHVVAAQIRTYKNEAIASVCGTIGNIVDALITTR